MKKIQILLLIFLSGLISRVYSQTAYDDPKNHACLKCHSSQIISFHNEVTNTDQKRLMNPYYIIDTTALRTGVHKGFDCTDCHSYDYTTYPHDSKLKLQPLSNCLDCHGGDPSFEKYHFERIDEEFKKSIHYKTSGDNFSCSRCHDQHTYRPMARNSSSVEEIVKYSNSLCLSCHNNMSKYELIAGHENPQLIKIHEWLPNQELHFKNVRCIECHTEVTDSLMVSHNILSKDKALRKCNECHNSNSHLKASLYKYENLKSRTDQSFVKSVLSNESYVIGSQQFPILKKLSYLIFFITLGAISIHLIFRFLKKK